MRFSAEGGILGSGMPGIWIREFRGYGCMFRVRITDVELRGCESLMTVWRLKYSFCFFLCNHNCIKLSFNKALTVKNDALSFTATNASYRVIHFF